MRNKMIILSSVGAMLLMSGCATIKNEKQLLPTTSYDQKRLNEIQATKDSKIQSTIRPTMDQNVTGTFFRSTVYQAVTAISSQVGVSVDGSFIPSEKYKITADVASGYADFLKLIRDNSGVDYKLRNGVLTVTNKDLIDESIAGKQCGIGMKPTVEMSVLEPVSPDMILKMFADKYHMSFIYKTKYYDLAGNGGGDLIAAPKVTFHYSGCDSQEAFRSFIKASNLVAEETSPNSYTISDYEVATVDVPLYFNYKFDSASGSVGGGGGGMSSSSQTHSQSGAGAGGMGANGVTDSENQKDTLQAFIQKYLSQKGKVVVSQRGYVTVEDTTESVRNIKKILAKEIQKQRPIKLNIAIIRTELINNRSAGIDWKAMGDLFSDKAKFSMGANYASSVTQGAYFTADIGLPLLINALEKYGDSKIVRDYNAITKLGILNSFKAVEQIPYVTTTTTVSSGVAQTHLEARTAEAGVVINVTPRLDSTGEYVDLSTSITVSELIKMVSFGIQGSAFELPQIASNSINIPAKIKMNQTLILTGFKSSSNDGGAEGLPGVSHAPTGLGWLFGTEHSKAGVSEFVIVITPTSIEEV